MATVTRSNPKCFDEINARLKEIDGKVAKAGWFASSVYENGMSVAAVAAIHEFGANINHPGGTPYKIGADGQAIFVAKNAPGASALPKTKPHKIHIPPRPFMRPTIAAQRNEWLRLLGEGAKAILRGKATIEAVLGAVGAKAAGDVAKTITSITSPPLRKSTVRARLRQMADRKTIGSIDKPLVHTGILLNSITNTVEDA